MSVYNVVLLLGAQGPAATRDFPDSGRCTLASCVCQAVRTRERSPCNVRCFVHDLLGGRGFRVTSLGPARGRWRSFLSRRNNRWCEVRAIEGALSTAGRPQWPLTSVQGLARPSRFVKSVARAPVPHRIVRRGGGVPKRSQRVPQGPRLGIERNKGTAGRRGEKRDGIDSAGKRAIHQRAGRVPAATLPLFVPFPSIPRGREGAPASSRNQECAPISGTSRKKEMVIGRKALSRPPFLPFAR